MIEVEQSLPLPNLSLLELPEIVVQTRGKDGFIVYLDFKDAFYLDSSLISKNLSALNVGYPPSPLSFSGWVGFFGYEFLAANLGIALRSKRDLDIRDGWFGRPQTIIHLLPNRTKIESVLHNRESELENLLKFPPIHNLSTIEFPTTSQKCNLSFSEYEKILPGQRRQFSTERAIRLKFPSVTRQRSKSILFLPLPSSTSPILHLNLSCFKIAVFLWLAALLRL